MARFNAYMHCTHTNPVSFTHFPIQHCILHDFAVGMQLKTLLRYTLRCMCKCPAPVAHMHHHASHYFVPYAGPGTFVPSMPSRFAGRYLQDPGTCPVLYRGISLLAHHNVKGLNLHKSQRVCHYNVDDACCHLHSTWLSASC